MVPEHAQPSGRAADNCTKDNEEVQSGNNTPHQQDLQSPRDAGRHRESPLKAPTQGSLRCPFAAAGSRKQQHSTTSTLLSHHEPCVGDVERNGTHSLSHPPSDPIEAELHGAQPAPEAQSPSESAHKCPIRFLSHHSAEEVAQYFERHKHEIPRSHEVCVRRHQENEETIQQLDAKYKNLVSMIQDLGLKHQPLLPAKNENEAGEGDKHANHSVEEWAGEVSQAYQGSSVEEPFDTRGRQLHSDHPLKEVRLGESPSRPWGIPIPVNDGLSGNTTSHAHFQRDENPAPAAAGEIDRSQLQPSRIVEHHSGAGLGSGPPHKTRVSVPQSENHAELSSGVARILQAPRAQMTFTGPVFIGYQLDDAVTLLKHSTAGP